MGVKRVAVLLGCPVVPVLHFPVAASGCAPASLRSNAPMTGFVSPIELPYPRELSCTWTACGSLAAVGVAGEEKV